jgi:CubicO group peptidase (beta-lactamase class C family)
MAGPVEGAQARLLSTMATFVADARLSGATAGIVHLGEPVWTGSVGFADIATERIATPLTLHRIASITKTFTATAVLQLRDGGALDLDDPVVVHVPEAVALVSTGPVESITLRRLLSHESGLQGEPPGSDWAHGIYEGDVRRTLERAGDLTQAVPPNTQTKYSNHGYQILGEVVARRSGLSFQEYVRTHILDPLGMARTTFDPSADGLLDDVATPYLGRWMSDELRLAPESPMSSSEGGLWSCVDDLVRWVSFALETDDDSGHPGVLSVATRREMHRPRYLTDEEWTSAFGLGWYGVRKDDVIWVQHGGSLFGYQSNVCFDPKNRVGAVVLLNNMGEAAALAMSLAAIARTAVVEAGPVVRRPRPLPASYADLVGVYADAEFFGELLHVEWRDDVLCVVFPDRPGYLPELAPTADPDTFVVGAGYRWSGEQVRFLRGEDGRVRSAAFPGQVMPRFDVRT